MRSPLRFLIFLFLLVKASAGYSGSINLLHLTKEEYTKQIEQATDSAYAELGMKNTNAKYYENTYEWIVKLINGVIDKKFHPKITYRNDMPVDIAYQIAWQRSGKDISFSLLFYNKGRKIGEAQILYGTMTDSGVEGIIRLNSCKKEIERILQGEI